MNQISTQLQPLNDNELLEYLETFGIGKTLTSLEKSKFVKICQAFSLNPFKREIHVTKFGNTVNIIVGYEVYLKRAERTGKLAGWKTWFESVDDDLCCHIEIHRQDWKFPLVHTVYMSEYGNDKSPMWKRMPKMMLRKVAISSGFRLAFPEDIGGMPYEGAEIGDDSILSSSEDVNINLSNVPEKSKQAIQLDGNAKPKMKNLDGTKEEKTDSRYWEQYRPTTLPSVEKQEQSVLDKILTAVEKCTNIETLQLYCDSANNRNLDADSTMKWRNAMVEKANQLGGVLKL